MKEDPIVAEVRKARAQIVRQCGNDLTKLFEYLRSQEKPSQDRDSRSKKTAADTETIIGCQE